MKKDNISLLNQFEILKGKKVLIACSTGVDSIVLLHLAMKYLNKEDLAIAHVNHKKRLQSEVEEEYIKSFAKENKINIYVKELSTCINNNFQSWARDERYAFFYEICNKFHYEYLLLAHHADDNLETILMRLLKSSSLKGYAGIEQLSTYKNIKVYRPLLYLSKEEIYEIAHNNNLKYFEDSSNAEDDYERNRIRHNIVPLLKEENPNIYNAIKNYSDTLLNANLIVEEKMQEFIKNVRIYNHNNYLIKTFSFQSFSNLNLFLKEQILFRLTKEVGLSKKTINEILKQSNESSKIVNKINSKLLVIKEYEDILLVIGNYKIEEFNLEIKNEGSYLLPNGINLEVKLQDVLSSKIEYNSNLLKVSSFPVVIRTRLTGDKMELSTGTNSVSDILTNKKVKYLDRLNTFVVTNKSKITKLLIYNQCKEDK